MAGVQALQETFAVVPRVAIIGGGAAGLACARVFTRDGEWCAPSVFEKDSGIGGVWDYREEDTKGSNRPMYRSLRTNLPKELMSFREFPWPQVEGDASFLSHRQVYDYLKQYRKKFDIQVVCRNEVKQLKVLSTEADERSFFSPSATDDVWPRVELTIKEVKNGDGEETCVERTEVFDAVLVANGHYSLPSIPFIPGLNEHFIGQKNKRAFHSVEYDDPSEFREKTVLCIGGRASGSDIAREIAEAGAKRVYLSDSARTTGEERELDAIIWVPKTIQILEGGIAQFDLNCPKQAEDVDAIIFCTGYDYSFPFINEESGLELDTSDRRVTPLFEQLWHARYPHIAFIGLPHSVVPFPLFEFQAEACLNTWRTKCLPTLSERMEEATRDANSGGEGKPCGRGRICDTHYLAGAQWNYCKRMADYAGIYGQEIEAYLRVNKEIYEHTGEQRGVAFPGGVDSYRGICYERDHCNFQPAAGWRVRKTEASVASNIA